jgi:DNA-binding NarL/FixJ family response regulator
MSKDAAGIELPRAVHQLLAGRKYITLPVAELMASQLQNPSAQAPHELLSDREYQTLLLIASGKSISQIAEELSLGVSTVSTYRVRILDKMGMKNNAELTHYAIDRGLV